MKDLKEKALRFLKRIKEECGNRETVLLFALVVAVMYCPVWGGYLLYAVFRWKWCFAVASAYLVFWAGPFTPFFPICIAITLFLKRLIRRLHSSRMKGGKIVCRDVYMAENCGMENERICFGIEEIPDESSYYVTVIAKETRSEYGSE